MVKFGLLTGNAMIAVVLIFWAFNGGGIWPGAIAVVCAAVAYALARKMAKE